MKSSWAETQTRGTSLAYTRAHDRLPRWYAAQTLRTQINPSPTCSQYPVFCACSGIHRKWGAQVFVGWSSGGRQVNRDAGFLLARVLVLLGILLSHYVSGSVQILRPVEAAGSGSAVQIYSQLFPKENIANYSHSLSTTRPCEYANAWNIKGRHIYRM